MRYSLITILATSLAFAAQEEKPAIFKEIDELVADLVKITGLKALKKVESDTITKDGLKQFLEERIKEAVKPEDIRAEEIALKKLGLAPADFDLRKMTVDLLTEQAAAFYDYRKKKLFILDTNATMMQRPILVHELSHALADQHFNLEKFLLNGKSDDSGLARMAVMEGQATWLMSEYIMSKMGTSLKKSPDMAEWMNKMSSGSSGGMYPVFDSAPMYLRESLMFPYSKGLLFQNEVIRKLGDPGFSEVFRNPPSSSQQILHPEKYFAKVLPSKPELPKVKLKGYTDLVDGNLGEFDHDILLRQHVDEKTAELATKWRGSQYRVLENKKTNRHVLLYASEWADAEAAKEMFAAYRKVMKSKWKKFEVATDTASLITGACDDGHFKAERNGTRVLSVEGLEQKP